MYLATLDISQGQPLSILTSRHPMLRNPKFCFKCKACNKRLDSNFLEHESEVRFIPYSTRRIQVIDWFLAALLVLTISSFPACMADTSAAVNAIEAISV